MRRFLVCLLFSVAFFWLHAADTRKHVIVSDQLQFNALDATVKNNLKRGVTELVVTIQQGVYYYGEKHLDFSSLNYPKANVVLEGKGAVLVAKNLGRDRHWQDGLFDQRTKSGVGQWTALEQSPEEVEVIDADAKLCRVRTASRQRRQGEEQCRGQYVQLTEWYDSKVYPVVRKERRYVYFTATDLEYLSQYGCWNVNADVAYGHCNPRFRLTDAEASASMHVCQASTFVNLWHSSLGSFTLRGITFGPNNGSSPLVDTDMFSSRQLLVESCVFSGVRGLVLKVWFTDNVLVRSNTFESCYHNGIESFNGSRKTQVIGNTFRNHGEGLRQNFGVICRGEDFLVKGNKFRNFSYSAIGVGVWFGHQHDGPVKGQVVENDLAFESDYYDDYARHTLMDAGAIYSWTICDQVVISANKINRYRGMKDYRGIFCDDGGKNLTVKGNSVTNIGDDCWCIDLRWVDHVSGKVPDHNTGNDVRDNKVDGPIRFERRKP